MMRSEIKGTMDFFFLLPDQSSVSLNRPGSFWMTVMLNGTYSR
jgi:hypothetical protein